MEESDFWDKFFRGKCWDTVSYILIREELDYGELKEIIHYFLEHNADVFIAKAFTKSNFENDPTSIRYFSELVSDVLQDEKQLLGEEVGVDVGDMECNYHEFLEWIRKHKTYSRKFHNMIMRLLEINI